MNLQGKTDFTEISKGCNKPRCEHFYYDCLFIFCLFVCLFVVVVFYLIYEDFIIRVAVGSYNAICEHLKGDPMADEK